MLPLSMFQAATMVIWVC